LIWTDSAKPFSAPTEIVTGAVLDPTLAPTVPGETESWKSFGLEAPPRPEPHAARLKLTVRRRAHRAAAQRWCRMFRQLQDAPLAMSVRLNPEPETIPFRVRLPVKSIVAPVPPVVGLPSNPELPEQVCVPKRLGTVAQRSTFGVPNHSELEPNRRIPESDGASTRIGGIRCLGVCAGEAATAIIPALSDPYAAWNRLAEPDRNGSQRPGMKSDS
jgi:hypothetical protein